MYSIKFDFHLCNDKSSFRNENITMNKNTTYLISVKNHIQINWILPILSRSLVETINQVKQYINFTQITYRGHWTFDGKSSPLDLHATDVY